MSIITSLNGIKLESGIEYDIRLSLQEIVNLYYSDYRTFALILRNLIANSRPNSKLVEEVTSRIHNNQILQTIVEILDNSKTTHFKSSILFKILLRFFRRINRGVELESNQIIVLYNLLESHQYYKIMSMPEFYKLLDVIPINFIKYDYLLKLDINKLSDSLLTSLISRVELNTKIINNWFKIIKKCKLRLFVDLLKTWYNIDVRFDLDNILSGENIWKFIRVRMELGFPLDSIGVVNFKYYLDVNMRLMSLESNSNIDPNDIGLGYDPNDE